MSRRRWNFSGTVPAQPRRLAGEGDAAEGKPAEGKPFEAEATAPRHPPGTVVEPTFIPGGLLAGFLLAAVVAVCGTAMHRLTLGGSGFPVGLIVAALLLMATSVALRAAAGRGGVLVLVLVVTVGVLVLTYAGPGEDLLVTDDALSRAWLVVAPCSPVVGALVPRAWLTEDPVGR